MEEEDKIKEIKQEHDLEVANAIQKDFLPDPKEKNPVGNAPITPAELEVILQKLRPYLENGQTRSFALSKAEIPMSTFYNLMKKHKYFMEMVELYEAYPIEIANMANMNIIKAVQNEIAENLKDDSEKKKINPEHKSKLKLDGVKVNYLKWFTEKRDKRYKNYTDITTDNKPISNGGSFLPDLQKLTIEQLDDLIKDLEDGKTTINNSDGITPTSESFESTEVDGTSNQE